VQYLEQLSDEDLAELYDYPPGGEDAYLRANVVMTLDGSATGPDARSGSINDDADARVFALLRALADVVVVGAGTARVEGYRALDTPARWRALRGSLGLAEHPTLVVVSGSLALPEALFGAGPDAGPVLVITTEDADPRRADLLRTRLGPGAVLTAGRSGLDLDAAVEQLAGRGLRRVLVEGGPRLLGQVVHAGLLDELCLTMSPLLVGGDGPRVSAGDLADHRLRLRHALGSGGSLLTRWTRP
jgi:riboflavin biosynthesis pyrimidine reductase